MSELLSCVSGEKSWLLTSISPPCAEQLHLLNPLCQSGLTHQASSAKPEVGESRYTWHRPPQQIAKMRLTAPEHLCTLTSRQYLGQRVEVNMLLHGLKILSQLSDDSAA